MADPAPSVDVTVPASDPAGRPTEVHLRLTWRLVIAAGAVLIAAATFCTTTTMRLAGIEREVSAIRSDMRQRDARADRTAIVVPVHP